MISYTNFLESCIQEGKKVTEDQLYEIKEYLSERSEYISEEYLEILNESVKSSLINYISLIIAHKMKFNYLSYHYYAKQWINTIVQQNKFAIDLLNKNDQKSRDLKLAIQLNNFELDKSFQDALKILHKDGNNMNLFPKSIPSDEYRFPKIIDPINNLNFIKYYCNKNNKYDYELSEYAEIRFKKEGLI